MRLLAPAALAVFAIAFLVVVIASLTGDDGSSTTDRATAGANRERNSTPSRRREPRTVTRDNSTRRFYIVRAGDNLALIADRTGVSLADLRALNPSLDPQALVTGQRVRLRAASGTTGATGSTGSTGAQGSTGLQGGNE
jgi:hypothetical protein